MRGRGIALACVLAVVAGCDGDAPEAAVVLDTARPVLPEAVADPLLDEVYAFCHDAEAVSKSAERWCAVLDEVPEERCPGLHAACEAGTFAEVAGGCGGMPTGSRSDRLADLPEEAFEPPELDCDCASPDLSLPAALLRIGVALLLALGLVAIGRWLWRYLGLGSRAEDAAAAATLGVVEVELAPVEGDDDLPDLPEDELLAEARRALDAGRFGDAAVWARGAALRRLARRGALRLHRARTDREYLRTLGAGHEAHGALQLILRAVEDHRWAGRVLLQETAEAAVTAAGRILGTGLLALLLVLPGAGRAGVRHGIDGDAALHTLLDEAGYDVVEHLGSLSDLDAETDVVLLDLYGVEPSEADWEHLRAWVRDEGGLLVVAGEVSDALPVFGERVHWEGDRREVVLDGALGADLTPPRWPDGPEHHFCIPEPDLVTPLAWVRGRDVDPSAPCAPVVMAMVWRGAGEVVAISDPRLFWNGSFLLQRNRAFVARFLVEGDDGGLWAVPARPRVALAQISRGQGSSPPQSLANARLLPMVLHLLAAWLLLALWRGWPLVPLHDPPAPPRHDYAEHADALGEHLAREQAHDWACGAWARWALGTHGRRGLRARAARAGLDAAATAALLERIEAAASGDLPDDEAGRRALVEATWRITQTG